MANSCSLTSSSTYQGRTMTLSCTQTQDIANNRSLISWSLSVSGGSSHYYATGPTNVYINETCVWSKGRVGAKDEFPASDKVSGVSGELYIDHDSDGSKSISISLSTAIYYGSVKTDSTTWYLDSIARASIPRLSSSDFYFYNTRGEEDYITIYTDRKSTSFDHHLYFLYPNGLYGDPISPKFNDSFPFYPISTVNVLNYCKSSWEYSGQFLLRTYNGGTHIGDNITTFKVRVPDYIMNDPSSVNITNIDKYNGNILNNVSTVSISIIPGVFNYGADFDHLYITLVNITNASTGTHEDICRIYDDSPPEPVSGVYSINPKIAGIPFGSDSSKICGLKISIQDSRGKIKDYLIKNKDVSYLNLPDDTGYYTINVKKYTPPDFSIIRLYRCTSDGTKSENGTYIEIEYDSLITSGYSGVVSYCYKKKGEEYNSYETPTFIWDNNLSIWKLSSKIPNIANNHIYDFIIKLNDGVKDTLRGFTISLGKTDLNLTPNGIGFGQYYDSNYPNTIQTPYDLMIKGYKVPYIIYSDYMHGVNPTNNEQQSYSWYVERYSNGIVKFYGTFTTSYSNPNVLVFGAYYPFTVSNVISAYATLLDPHGNASYGLGANIKLGVDGNGITIWQHNPSGGYNSGSGSRVSIMAICYRD